MVLASVGPWTARGVKAALCAVDIISSTTILGVGLKSILGVKFAISREEGDERVGGDVCGTALERG